MYTYLQEKELVIFFACQNAFDNFLRMFSKLLFSFIAGHLIAGNRMSLLMVMKNTEKDCYLKNIKRSFEFANMLSLIQSALKKDGAEKTRRD